MIFSLQLILITVMLIFGALSLRHSLNSDESRDDQYQYSGSADGRESPDPGSVMALLDDMPDAVKGITTLCAALIGTIASVRSFLNGSQSHSQRIVEEASSPTFRDKLGCAHS